MGFSLSGVGQFLGILAAGGVFVLVIGFVLGTFPIVLLRLVFLLPKLCWEAEKRYGKGTEESGQQSSEQRANEEPCHYYYEAWLSPQCLKNLGKRVKAESLRPGDALVAAASFDHGILKTEKPGVHEWILRRWSSSNICARAFVGLVIAGITVRLGAIHPGGAWWWSVGITAIALLVQGCFAWWDTMKMIEFQATLPLPPDRDGKQGDGTGGDKSNGAGEPAAGS